MRSKCSEDDLNALITAAVRRKKKQHAGKRGKGRNLTTSVASEQQRNVEIH